MHKIDALTDSQSVGALPFRGRAVVFAVLSVPESTGIIVPACMAGSMRQCLCTAHLNPRLYGTIDARPNGAFPRPVAAFHKRIGPQPSVRQRFCTISQERCRNSTPAERENMEKPAQRPGFLLRPLPGTSNP